MSSKNSKLYRYIIHTMFEYAERKKLRPLDTWKKFEQSGIVTFLTEHYEIQHSLSIDETIEDIDSLMSMNGS